MPAVKIIFQFLRYYFSAQNRHDIHSPFFYHFVSAIIRHDSKDASFSAIDALRKKLKKDRTIINFQDFGAGSPKRKEQRVRVKSLLNNTAKPPRYARLLYRMIRELKPNHILELGTSLGVSTIHFSKAAPEATVITIEGSKEVAALAKKNFESTGCSNINLIIGTFDNTLEHVLQNIGNLDFVFFDGNHQCNATLNYFEHCLKKANANSIFVFDDINWSSDMQECWKRIKEHPAVTSSIDIFMMGIVFFNPDFTKQHYVIRY
jgi:predicted O-methyltransferase YrrM